MLNNNWYGSVFLTLYILQSKFAVVMRDNANLYEKLKDMEHQNLLLEGETDTIGYYPLNTCNFKN